ncbi:MAG TPA: YbhN family protein [Bauldia sp.]|nr:YbhN family protein [Bauldia sp.]
MLWPLVGLAVAALCVFLLVRELWSLNPGDVWASLKHVRPLHWLGAFGGVILAYAALAGYDRIALQHINRHLSWPFIAVASFVSYALSHNIGAAVLSGAVVRYRIYSTKGLSVGEIGVLVAFCAFTFGLGVTILGGILLIIHPELAQRFIQLPSPLAEIAGYGMLIAVALYVTGSLLHLKPLVLWGFSVFYPRPKIVLRQLIIGPMELIGAAAIIYFCLPEAGNPGFIIVLGIFLASFSLAVFSHAPGGLGVLELLFVSGLKDMPTADVLAALIVFRLFYLVLPLAISLVAVLIFERQQMKLRRDSEIVAAPQAGSVDSISMPNPSSPT